LESITSLTFALLVLTFIWPVAAIVFGSLNFVLRIGMVLSYSISAQARKRFSPFMILNFLAAMLTAVAGTIYWQVQVSPL